MSGRDRSWLLPLTTFALALALSVVPIAGSAAAFRPDWVPMVLIFWAVVRPQHFGLLTAFFVGLALDMLSGALLGRHALALLPIVYLTLKSHFYLSVVRLWQATVTVLLMLVVYHFLLFWIDGVAGRSVPGIAGWAPVVTSALVWPLALAALGGFRRAEAEPV